MPRGMQVPPRSKPPTQPPQPQRKRAKTARKGRKRRPKPVLAKVTTVSPDDRIHVGSRWYVVRNVRMIGRKGYKHAVCIVETLEKGGMHFRSTARVLKADPEVDI